MPRQEVVFFDVDETLIKGQSQKFFMDFLWRKKLISSFFYVRLTYWFFLYKINVIKDPKTIAQYAFGFLKGMNKDELIKLVDLFFNEVLIFQFYEEALSLIKEHKKRNAKIFLVSNAFDVLVERISLYVGADDFVATRLERKNNIFTGGIRGTINYSEEKVGRVVHFCQEKKVSLENSWGYADHISDLPFLRLMKNSVAVNARGVFQENAKALGFKILVFKK